MLAVDRWRPGMTLLVVCVAVLLFLAAAAGAALALRGPVGLGYQVAPTSRPDLWRISAVWPDGFAHDAGLRRGMLLYSRTPPALQGQTTVAIWSLPCCRHVVVPPPGETVSALEWLELLLAASLVAIGAGTLLLARERGAALLLLAVCLSLALGLCGAAAFARGALWGSVLLETCLFVLLTPLMPLLALSVPPDERAPRLPWRSAIGVAALLLALDVAGYVNDDIYNPTRDIATSFFILAQLLAIIVWLRRARAARRSPAWPQYRLVLGGLGGAFGSFALLAMLPSMLAWPASWPREAGGVGLILFPAGLSLALLRHRLFHLRHPIQRTAITVLLLSGALAVGLGLAMRGMDVAGVGVAVLLAGIGLPVAQRAADRLLPDSRTAYAALLREIGERLDAAIDPAELTSILERLRIGLGLDGLCLRLHDGAVLARSGRADPVSMQHLDVRHEDRLLAILEIGEKRHDECLLEADYEALGIACQQIAAYLARRQLLLDLRAAVYRLEEMQLRLLSARRRERERLLQQLHRGPLQDIILLERMLPPSSTEAAEATAQIARSLRTILTETGSTMLATLGLPRALRSYVEYLAPAAQARGCTLSAELDEQAAALAEDEAFALYQLAHEALANVVRHSRARQATLRLWLADGRVHLEVRDDGRGLPVGWDRPRLDHRGLLDALDMVLSVGGAMAEARQGCEGGTVVRAAVPWRPRQQPGVAVEQERAMSGDGTIGILIAEDHALMREGLRRLLAEDARLHVVAEAATGHEILSLVLRHRPDVVLADIDLPGQSGLEAVRALHAHISRPPRVIMLSAFHNEEYIRQAREIGVAGFLTKDCEGPALRAAIVRVMAGEEVFEAPIAHIMKEQKYSAEGRLRRYADGSPAISPAEMEVLRAMVSDASYEEIAQNLGRARGTVRAQAAKVCEKLGVNTRQQAVLKALELGLLRLEEVHLLREAQHRDE